MLNKSSLSQYRTLQAQALSRQLVSTHTILQSLHIIRICAEAAVSHAAQLTTAGKPRLSLLFDDPIDSCATGGSPSMLLNPPPPPRDPTFSPTLHLRTSHPHPASAVDYPPACLYNCVCVCVQGSAAHGADSGWVVCQGGAQPYL